MWVVELQQGLNEREGRAFRQHVVLALELVLRVGFETLLLEDPVLFFEIEQRTGRDAHHEHLGEV